jgi:serine/threonine-protein kinase RsbW
MSEINIARDLFIRDKVHEAAIVLDRLLQQKPQHKKARRILTAIRKCYLTIDDENPLFDTAGMRFKEFYSDYNQVRFFALIIMQGLSENLPERRLLEQQISEVIKNAIRHGNKGRLPKRLQIWYEFTPRIRFIVSDEGSGMSNMENWNEFNRNRRKAIGAGDFEALMNFAMYKSEQSEADDGGNSLFAALEYWDEGLMYNAKRNKVVVVKKV